MTLEITKAVRRFSYSGVELPDPDPDLNPDEVRQHWAAVYPELTVASVEGPTVTASGLEFKFLRAVRDKG